MNGQDSKAETFDVFLCHNSEDKLTVREIADKLSHENIKPWLDEADIKPGVFWHDDIGRQIGTAKSAAVFIGQHGVGPWQRREIIALLDEFDRRACTVIPVILESAPRDISLPWSLMGLHCVDFRATSSQPLKRLVWGITGQKPAELLNIPDSERPATMQEAAKRQLLPGSEDNRVAAKKTSKVRLYPALAQSPDQGHATQLDILRRRVMEYWVDGVLTHSLYHDVLISLGNRNTDGAVDAPWKYTVEMSEAVSSEPLDDRDVSTIYDATGLLLILGEPGSGKTTTLLALARSLLERAGDDIIERVPIVLNLSGWKKTQPLEKWISGELSDKYRVPEKVASFWLQSDYLLPLLDGLDEVATSTQPDCVAAINKFIETSSPSGLVICCRLNEYRWLPKRLKLNGAISIQSLGLREIGEYLATGGDSLAALREAIHTDPVLQELAKTPLMLNIMCLALHGIDGDALESPKSRSLKELREYIFRLYVDRMFQRKATRSLMYSRETTIRWLSSLAKKMRALSLSVLFVDSLNTNWLRTIAEELLYNITAILSMFMTCWIIFIPIYVLIFRQRVPRGESLAWAVGILSANFLGIIIFLLSGEIDLKSRFWSWDWKEAWNAVRKLGGFLPFAIYSGVVGGVACGLNRGLLVGIFCAAATTLLIVLFVGLLVGSATALREAKLGLKRERSACQEVKLFLKNSLLAFLWTSLCFGALLAAYNWLFGVIGGLETPSMQFVLAGALLTGIISGLQIASSLIKHYSLRLILWLRGYFPFKCIRFLDQCVGLVLLKKVGTGYIFIHRIFLEYFADLNQSDAQADAAKRA